MTNSAITSGTDHAIMKMSQAIRNEPPPLAAATRGNRQMFPVPTAMPNAARINPHRELKYSSVFAIASFLNSSSDSWLPLNSGFPSACQDWVG